MTLPCFPCPHHSVCCRWGTRLTVDEAIAIARTRGRDKVHYSARDRHFRTVIKNGRCVFSIDNACVLHDTQLYPAICRGFPDINGITGEAYEYDKSICPELEVRE